MGGFRPHEGDGAARCRPAFSAIASTQSYYVKLRRALLHHAKATATVEWREECCYPVDRISFHDMATAISSIYISDGFVIAADGLERASATGRVVSDCEQKIVSLRHELGVIGCAITGTGRIEDYRLSREIPRIAGTLETCDARTLGEYAECLARELRRSIKSRFPRMRRPVTIKLLFDGYMNGRPDRARATLHCGFDSAPRTESAPLVESPYLWPGKSTGYGSEAINRALFESTLKCEPLRRYWSVCQQELRTISRSVLVADAVISAQCDPQVVAALDPRVATTIGGHIHIAKISVSGGFEWAVEPS